MSCELTQRYVPGYLDGELDLVHTIEMEAHLKGCPACAQELESLRELRAAMRRSSLAYVAPAALRERIQASLRASSGDKVQQSKIKWPSLNFLQLAGAFALLALISMSGWQLTGRSSDASRVTSESRQKYSPAHDADRLGGQSSNGCHLHRPTHRETLVRRQA